jgi:hypothetical protein
MDRLSTTLEYTLVAVTALPAATRASPQSTSLWQGSSFDIVRLCTFRMPISLYLSHSIIDQLWWLDLPWNLQVPTNVPEL